MVKKMIKLGDIATYINGYAFKPEDRGKVGLPIIRIQDLTGNSYDLGFYDGIYPQKIEINDGDVLISWSASLGVYIWNRGKALLNQHIFKVEFDKTDIDKQYFVFAVRYKLKEMERKTHGATMKHIVKKDFDATEIPYPPYEEQVEIATNLDKIFRIIESRNQELQLLDDLVSARFVEMFGDPRTNSKGFQTKKGNELFKISNGKAVPNNNRFKTGIPAYGGNGISWYTDKVLYKYDTIVIGRVGFQSGNVHLVKGPIWITDNAMYISDFLDDSLSLFFLYEMMEQIDFTRHQDAGDLKKVTQKPFMDMDYIVPPKKLQNEFADFVRQTDKSKLALHSLLTFLTLYELHIQSNNLTSEKF